MVSLRSPAGPVDRAPEGGDAAHDDDDWLTLSQAACELGISISTVRRRLRQGWLRNRIVPRPGGFAYLIYLPGNSHSGGPHRRARREPDIEPAHGNGHVPNAGQEREIRRLEQQVEALAHALSRTLRVHQVALPAGIGKPSENGGDPYARYRWLVRRRRWWPFS